MRRVKIEMIRMQDGLSRTFGDEQVEPQERRRRIRALFDAIAPRYDLMNDLMSFGLHRLWKRSMARTARGIPGADALDLAGGTGDVARLLVRDGRANVTVCDPSDAMMRRGRERSGSVSAERIRWVTGEGEKLPFAEASFDVVTIAFGLRNMTSTAAVLSECRRCLRPGGSLICLEFSRPVWWLRPFYEAYSRLVIPRLGAWVARHPDAYRYLIESIRRFPSQLEVCAMFEGAGFERVSYRNLMLGIACLHVGYRP